MANLNQTIGWINCATFVAITSFMVVSCVRKHKLTGFVWFGLYSLQFCIIIVAIGQLVFKNIGSRYCNFGLGVIYTVEVCILFLLSLLIGYKTYVFCKEINDFALHGNLPSERSKKWKRVAVVTIWAVALSYLVTDLILSFYWRFNAEDLNTLDKFTYINKWVQALMFIIVSALFLFSARLLRDLQLNLHSKQRPLIRTSRIIWLLFVSYTAIWTALIYSGYT